MTRTPGQRVIPTAQEVLHTAGASELPVATLETLPPAIPPVPLTGLAATLQGIVLKREGRVQINANIEETLYRLMETYEGGITRFFKDAVIGGLKDVQGTVRYQVEYEEMRKLARKRGDEVRTVSCKLEKSIYRQLQAVEADCRVVEGFKLSKYITTCLWAHAKHMGTV